MEFACWWGASNKFSAEFYGNFEELVSKSAVGVIAVEIIVAEIKSSGQSSSLARGTLYFFGFYIFFRQCLYF
jgi:hypothetical protein